MSPFDREDSLGGSIIHLEIDGNVEGGGNRHAGLCRRDEMPGLDGDERRLVEHGVAAAGDDIDRHGSARRRYLNPQQHPALQMAATRFNGIIGLAIA